MECPNCHHISSSVLVRCSRCDQAFDRADIEEYQALAFMEAWLKERRTRLGSQGEDLLQEAQQRRLTLAQRLHLDTRPLPLQQRELLQLQSTAGSLNGWIRDGLMDPAPGNRLALLVFTNRQTLEKRGVTAEQAPLPEEGEVLAFLQHRLADWVKDGTLPQNEYSWLHASLEFLEQKILARQQTLAAAEAQPVEPLEVEEAVAAAAAPEPALADPVVLKAPAPPAPPAAPPKAAAPPFDASKAMQALAEKSLQALVSGALTRALLYLGAFIVVVTLTALVLAFWDMFPALLQVGFIFLVPTLFYAAGWGIQTQLKLPVAGSVMFGIGALIFALDFAAVYQFLDLGLARIPYWFGASLACLVLYALTTWIWQRSEVFGYLTMAALSSALAAGGWWLSGKPDWGLLLVGLVGPAGVIVANVWKERPAWAEVSRAARRSSLAAPWLVIFSLLPSFFSAGGEIRLALALGLGALTSSLLALWFPARFHLYAAAFLAAGALAAPLMIESLWAWIPALLVILSGLYMTLSLWSATLTTIETKSAAGISGAWMQTYSTALRRSSLILWALGAAGALVSLLETSPLPVISASALAALALGAYSFSLPRPWLLFWAGLLALMPLSLAWEQWGPQTGPLSHWHWLASLWLLAAMLGLAGLFALGGFPQHGRALAFFSQAVSLLVLGGMLFGLEPDWPLIALYGLGLVFYGLSLGLHATSYAAGCGAISDPPPQSGASAAGAALDGPVHLFSKNPGLWRPGFYLWPLAILLPLEVSLLWGKAALAQEWLGPALATLGLAYVFGGSGLARLRSAYRLPLHLPAYFLAGLGIWLAMIGGAPSETGWASWPLIAACFAAAATLAALAFSHARQIELYPAAWLSYPAAVLAFSHLNLADTAYGLVLAGLAVVYFGLGAALERLRSPDNDTFKFGLPLYSMAWLGGLAASGLAFVPWQGPHWPLAAGLWIVLGLIVAGQARWAQWEIFAWLTPVWLVAAFALTLSALDLSLIQQAPAWGLYFCLLILGIWLLQHSRRVQADWAQSGWLSEMALPVVLAAVAAASIGLGLTLEPVLELLVWDRAEELERVLWTQAALILGVILASALFRKHWLAIPFPALAWLALTVFFAGYGEQLFGKPLSSPQYGLVWAGLGLGLQALGWALQAAALNRTGSERFSPRFADWQWLAGYGLAALALARSAYDQPTLLWTLAAWIVGMSGSALLVHFKRHAAWQNWRNLALDRLSPRLGALAFLALAGWPFPLWYGLLAVKLGATQGLVWFAIAAASLGLVILGLELGRVQRAYSGPLYLAAHLYTLVFLGAGLPVSGELLSNRFRPTINSLPFNDAFGYLLAQIAGVAFYAAWAVIRRQRRFSLLAAALSWLPFTLLFYLFRVTLSQAQFALPWLGWAALLLALAFLLDRRAVRHSHSLYLAGYSLAIFALAWSFREQRVSLYVIAGVIVLGLISQAVEYAGRHFTWADLLRWTRVPETEYAARILRNLFLFTAAYLLPVGLAQGLALQETPLAWRGVALALAAPLYVALGLGLRRLRPEFAWPWYSAGYALSAIGAMVSFENEALAIDVLLLNTVLYAVSALIFRQTFWLYLSTALAPLTALLALHYRGQLYANWIAWTLMVFALAYYAIAHLLQRRSPAAGRISAAAAPFYLPAFVLSAAALAVASSERELAIGVYSVGVLLYSLAAWNLREPLFLYPAAWLAVAPYFLLLSRTALPAAWYGMAWLPLILLYLGLGRLIFHRRPLFAARPEDGFASHLNFLAHPAMPFYLMGYGLSLNMIVLSAMDARPFTAAFAAAALLYLASALVFRYPAWLYPALLCTHLGLLTFFTISPSGSPPQMISLPFHALTWVVTWLGVWLAQRGRSQQQLDFGGLPSFGHLITPSWAQPLFIFAGLDILLWQSVAMGNSLTVLVVSLGHMLLLGLLATYWQDKLLLYFSLAALTLGLTGSLALAGVPVSLRLASLAVLGFGLYLINLILSLLKGQKFQRLALWPQPLARTAVGLAALSVLLNLRPSGEIWPQALAASLAFSGALYLAIAYRGRFYRLGYLALAMLLAAWTIFLVKQNVPYAQLYAIPFGLYFMLLGEMERQRSGRRVYALLLEIFGILVLLISAFVQSLNGREGFPYFILMLVEGLGVTWWGAYRRRRLPFLIGLGANFLNVISQTVVLLRVYEVDRLFIFLGLGALILVGGVLMERRREQLIARAQMWRDGLDSWN